MAVAIPNAFHGSSSWFGVAYVTVQLLVLGMQGTTAFRDAATRQAFINFASLAVIAPIFVVIGGFTHDRIRLAMWIVAAVVNVGGAIRGASGEWVINPVHFAERHTLFVIICLGEALVAIGATASDLGLRLRILVGLVAATAVACVLWWVYFAFIPDVAEHTLEATSRTHRGQVARDLFTFGHFPIITGIIAYAVVVKRMVGFPNDPLPVSERWLLIAAFAMLIGGCLHIQFRVIHRLAPERFVAIATIAAWVLLGSTLHGSVIVAGIAVILAAMQSITYRRYRSGPLPAAIADH
jgi:low temperature requirement protein LtrA